MPENSTFGGSAAASLRRELQGEVRTDALTLGLYSTDASIYQVRPAAVVLPKSVGDVQATLAAARREGLSVTPRGAGTSQGGQAIGSGIVIDTSRWMARVRRVDPDAAVAEVDPGIVLDRLNAELAPSGTFFPVDVATSSRATLGGMVGNNSAGARSIRYGIMADNVRAIDAVLADGSTARFGRVGIASTLDDDRTERIAKLRAREADELDSRVPKVLRHVAGYGLHRVDERGGSLADLLVGSEGTLAFFTGIELALARRPAHRALAVCHFATLHRALAAVETIVQLGPSAVELTDGTLIDLGRENPEFADRLKNFVQGNPGALLFVEFAGDDGTELQKALGALERLPELAPGPVVRAESPALQAEVWAVRKAGMNIVMSGRSARKPVSIIEDCAIPLPRLAEWGDRLQAIFRRHGVDGTWYAHASVGCLHVRPSLDVREARDVRLLRAIAEEAHEVVAELGGSHSGEHGDGRIRSEFIAPMLGTRLARAFSEVKSTFDPDGLLNPGIIVDPVPMDDRSTFRYRPDYRSLPVVPALDWSGDDGLLTSIERCNNNGACRKLDPGVMCPSYRVTHEEIDTPRGRANALRLALTGQLGSNGLASDEVYEALDLCVGCKACRRECPTGVDVAKMKTEALAQRRSTHGLSLRTRIFAHLPRTAPRSAGLGALMNGIVGFGPGRSLVSQTLGITPDRPLPNWSGRPFDDRELPRLSSGADVFLFADTFNRWFEPENLRAAARVLGRSGARVGALRSRGRPLCCGRTYLSAGMVPEARAELTRTARVLAPLIETGGLVVGLEPSCILTFRDEASALLDQGLASTLASGTLLLEEFLSRRDWPDPGVSDRGADSPRAQHTVHVHGHCHQKAFGVEGTVTDVLSKIPGIEARAIKSSCCGMAGSFGYETEHVGASRAMAELDLLPAVRAAGPEATIVADGFSCRHQISELSGVSAVHAAVVLDEASRSERS